MLRTLILIFATSASLAAPPALAQSKPDDSQDLAMMQAVGAMQACMVAKARAADDGKSDPHKIAVTLKDTCRPEQDRFAALAQDFAKRHPGFEAPPTTLSDADRIGGFEGAILQIRKGKGCEPIGSC